MRDRDDDPHHLAQALHYLDHRSRYLEVVYKAAKKYIKFGQEEEEHAVLVKAIEAAERDHGTGKMTRYWVFSRRGLFQAEQRVAGSGRRTPQHKYQSTVTRGV